MVIIVVVITGGDINVVILMEGLSSDNVTKVVAVLLWMMAFVSLAKNVVI